MDGINISEILNIVLGGGLVATIVAIGTLRSTVRKAKAESMKAEADAETVRIDNANNATRILVENIVKPLKTELNATRTDLQATKKEMASTKREMARLRKAVETATGCPHSDGCPVLSKLRGDKKDLDNSIAEQLDNDPRHPESNEASELPNNPGSQCDDDDQHRQPP